MIIIVLQLLICAFLLILSSHYASKFGTQIAREKNWSEGFVGVLFLAFATSMPEVFASISVVPECFSIAKIDLGFANAIGSLIINLMILAVLDIFISNGQTFTAAKKENIITSTYTIAILFVIVTSYFIRMKWPSFAVLFNVGIESFLIIGLYIMGMGKLVSKRHDHQNIDQESVSYRISPSILFFAFLFIVFALSFWLGNISNAMIEKTKINESFIGALFMAFVTSLPELTVSLAALRLNSPEMSIGNILGSNFFDCCIVPLMDMVYRPAAIIGRLNAITLIVSGGALLLTIIVVLSLLRERKVHKPRFILPSVVILIIGTLSYWLMYRAG
ncbi:MAG: hypothetical protein PHQ52_03050 [Candidatus Omnitrophica bacterium]|nr:hypothetical protein [Candidatus Omnitrophota bacterium]